MIQQQFEAAAYDEIEGANNQYLGARYAPIGNQQVGEGFPLYKQSGAYFTDWTPAGQSYSNFARRVNAPTNNTLARNAMQDSGVKLANQQNAAAVYRTQTLGNNGDVIACRNNADCSAFPGTTCNPNYESWGSAKGNQGNYCSVTFYPEIEGGVYSRKNTNQGGIGRACKSDGDCAGDYVCNNKVDIFGTNVQQTGYCTKKYRCPSSDEDKYLGQPYNSGLPLVPPDSQNNYGRGYDTREQCMSEKFAQQNCVNNNGKYYALFPGYCGVIPDLRSGSSPVGALPRTSMSSVERGIVMPGYVSNEPSSISQPANAFAPWNLNSTENHYDNMSGPLAYELSINPK